MREEGSKRIAPEEEKNSLDERELVARFRSKKDLYSSPNDYIGQCYMLAHENVTKDFLKLVFSGKKRTYPTVIDKTYQRSQIR